MVRVARTSSQGLDLRGDSRDRDRFCANTTSNTYDAVPLPTDRHHDCCLRTKVVCDAALHDSVIAASVTRGDRPDHDDGQDRAESSADEQRADRSRSGRTEETPETRRVLGLHSCRRNGLSTAAVPFFGLAGAGGPVDKRVRRRRSRFGGFTDGAATSSSASFNESIPPGPPVASSSKVPFRPSR